MSPAGTVWVSRDHVSILIACYRQHPILWNVKHADHKNRVLSDKAYEIILAEMQQHLPDLTLTLVKNKLHTLNGQLNKEWKLVPSTIPKQLGKFHFLSNSSAILHHSLAVWGVLINSLPNSL